MDDYEDCGISGNETLDYLILADGLGDDDDGTGCLAFILLPIIGALFFL